MASENQISAQQLLTNFNARKHATEDETSIEAQRLVNMYRNLSVFKPEFVEEFNQLLLSSSKEAQVLLPSIIGGNGVREYLTYLQQSQKSGPDSPQESDEEESAIGGEGFLPDPENDLVSHSSASTPAFVQDNSSLEGVLKSFAQENHHQNVVLENALSQIQEILKSQPVVKGESLSDTDVISDILKSQQEQFQNFALMMQNMFQTQTSLLNQTLNRLTDVVSALSQNGGIHQDCFVETKPLVSDSVPLSQPVFEEKEALSKKKTNNQKSDKKTPVETKSKKNQKPLEIDDDMEILTEFDLPQED